ncbi:hypothetical protein [Nocardia sp. NPDC004415]
MTLVLSRRRPSDDRSLDSRDEKQRPDRLWRIVAIVAGILGALLAVAVPLLPVQQQQASFSWPEGGRAESMTAPLVSYSPVGIEATIPVGAITGPAPEGGYLLATVPPASGQAWHYGLNVLVSPADGGRLQVVLRDKTLVDTPVADLPRAGALAISSTAERTTVTLDGTDPVVVAGDSRPQSVGLFTDLTGPAPEGMRARVEIDSRSLFHPAAEPCCTAA